MATIIPNKKKGKIVSFKFRAYVGQNQLRYLKKQLKRRFYFQGVYLL